MEYPKHENLYARNPDTHQAGPEYGLRVPEVGLVDKWLVTEKIDGMNIRVVFDPHDLDEQVTVYGRTDRAQLPQDLVATIRERATPEAFFALFEAHESDPERMIVYGEGYGAGIQSGGHYGDAKQFRIFDVLSVPLDGPRWWLQWKNVCDVSLGLGFDTVPVLATGVSTYDAKKYVSDSKLLGDGHPKVEGIVCRTDPYLFTQRGQRVTFKYKVRDLS